MKGFRVLAVIAVVAAAGSCNEKKPSSNGKPGNAGANDVVVSACGVADNQFEGAEATLTVTNSSSTSSSYIITVAFDSLDGTQQLDTGNATVETLGPNQSATTKAVSFKSEIRDQQFTCKVAEVNRLAS